MNVQLVQVVEESHIGRMARIMRHFESAAVKHHWFSLPVPKISSRCHYLVFDQGSALSATILFRHRLVKHIAVLFHYLKELAKHPVLLIQNVVELMIIQIQVIDSIIQNITGH